MIKFKEVKVRNFLSIGDKPITVPLSHHSIWFVGGWNEDDQTANGVGKTALFFDSIMFALFGEVRRGKSDSIVNFKNGRNCEVELTLEYKGHTYRIIRGRKPNKFLFYRDDEVIQYSSMRETQEALENELNLSKEIFSNLFFVNINHLTPLLISTPLKVKEYFEKFFFGDLIFRKIQKLARADKNAVQIKKTNLETEIKTMEYNLERQKEIVKLQEEQFKRAKAEVEALTEEVAKLREKLKNIEGRLVEQNKVEKLEEEFKKVQSIIIEKNYIVKEALKKLDFIEKHNVCPTCGQGLSKEYKEKIKKEAEKSLSASKAEIEKAKVVKETIDEKLKDIKEIKDEYNNVKTLLNFKEKQFNDAKKKFEDISKIHIQVAKGKEEEEGKLKELKQELEELKHKYELYEWLEMQFSENGIIQWFIEYVRAQLNRTIVHYTELLNFPYYFEFSEDLTLKARTIEFDGLSEGEKKLFNFILFFAMYDIFLSRAGNYSSMIVFDELFDSALAEDRIEQVLSIVRELIHKYNLSVFILSHRGDVMKDVGDGYIILRKKNGFTEIMNH